MPLVRRPILRAVSAFAGQVAPGSRVLDAGAGNAPYAELFGHCEYVTANWHQSVHEGARTGERRASRRWRLHPCPMKRSRRFCAPRCWSTLPTPSGSQPNLERFLSLVGGCASPPTLPGHCTGRPFDFSPLHAVALSHLLEQADFAEVSIEHRAGFLVTLAQMAEMTRWISSASGRPRKSQAPAPAPTKRLALVLVRACAEGIRWAVRRDPSLDGAAVGVDFPLGYQALAIKPDRDSQAAG